jgi:hypothetical protein
MRGPAYVHLLIGAVLLGAVSCSSNGDRTGPDSPTGSLRVIQAAESTAERRFDYLLAESTRISEPLPVAEPHLGRRTVLTFPLLPPPQKN